MIVPTADRLQGIDEYYFSKKLREVAQLKKQGHDIINLGIGSPDLPPSIPTVRALGDSAAQETSHGYQPYNGTDILRQAMADWYQQTYSVSLDSQNQILPLAGSKEGIYHISMAFLNPGDEVLIPDPGYPTYSSVTKLVGATPVFYDLVENNNWLPDLHSIARYNFKKVKIFWINFPHMPTGALAAKADFVKLIEFANAHKILLCHDNPYSLILNPEPPLSILRIPGAFDCCIELNSLSKSHNMAGWRIGMAAGRSDYIQAVLKVKSNMDSGMFLPLQHAAVAALKNSAEWHKEQNRIYFARRNKIYRLKSLLGCKFIENRPGLFVWSKAPEHVGNVEKFLDEILYHAGVFLIPGKIFGKNGERYIRGSLCVNESLIDAAILRIQKYLGK